MPHALVEGRKVYYETHGSASQAPLVLIMGMGGSCRGWLPLQVPEFCKQRQVIIFDNRGAGGSDDDGKPFSTRDLARDTVGLLDALQINQADVLGAFMGGMIAQHMALDFAERVNRLVLVGTYARPDAKRRLLLEQWKMIAQAGPALSSDLLMQTRLLWTLQDETLEETELIQAMTDFYKRDPLPLSGDLFMRQCDACLEHDTHARLGAIEQATLVLCGRNDQLTPPRLHQELADGIPDARLVTLHYGGHLVEAESAERFNEVVLQFLSDG